MVYNMSPEIIELGNVQETLLMPLWGRFVENQKKKPLLIDHKAEEIIKNIDYDFSNFEKSVHPLSRAAWIARSIYFDEKIIEHLRQYSKATILNIGCGLDTTFDRINNGKAIWYEIDFPDVIELRQKYLGEQENRIFISDSALSDEWYKKITAINDIFIFMGGVIYYFDEDEVKHLISKIGKELGKAEMVFDYSSIKGVEITNRKVLKKGGMNNEAKAKWGIDDIYEIEKGQPGIKVIENMNMFENYKKKYPVWKRLGMNISDRLKIMSLAKIEIIGA
jgi:O-methyltransferase involved in polyketide biosynthesis